MPAQLTPSEIAAVRSADKMVRVDYPGGNVKATDGHRTLFASGGPDSFAELWKQAERIRTEVPNGKN